MCIVDCLLIGFQVGGFGLSCFLLIVAKVAGELLLAYFAQRHAVDARGLRYPGLVSSAAEPGGGTTDYSCAFFKEAVESGRCVNWGIDCLIDSR